jgi:hypothetical protein
MLYLILTIDAHNLIYSYIFIAPTGVDALASSSGVYFIYL